MLKINFFLAITLLLLCSCKIEKDQLNKWISYDESYEIKENMSHSLERMRYLRIQSKHTDKNSFFIPFQDALLNFSNEEYEKLKPLILEKDILEIQNNIQQGKLTYEKLCLFYLYRIYLFETNKNTYLNSIIALNPNVLINAKKKDQNRYKEINHPLYGMPILLKDNIDALPMSTTAGAAALRNNIPINDAFIVKQLRKKGALILGKVNLSEWAYYFCEGCPLGYSAIGGQTLNPYGRMEFETGGSSSGSAVSVAANFAVAAIGSETSGSILSPSGKNSVVGLKPTVGLVSRSGIIPISSTLDTAGPMTKNIIDNAILLNAIIGEDPNDSYSFSSKPIYYQGLDTVSLKGKRLGIFRKFEKDSLMKQVLIKLRKAGATIVSLVSPELKLTKFRKLLDIDMKYDLPEYFNNYASDQLPFDSIEDIIAFNNKDSILNAPYGQKIFSRIIKEKRDKEDFLKEKKLLMSTAKEYFNDIEKHDLEAIISIDNYTATFAAAAHFPALGVPMGYRKNGQPQNLTFIAPSKKEQTLLELGAVFERINRVRKLPLLYE